MTEEQQSATTLFFVVLAKCAFSGGAITSCWSQDKDFELVDIEQGEEQGIKYIEN